MQAEQERISMSFKFECDVPPLLQQLAEKDNRSMTAWLEVMIRRAAIAAKLIKANGKPNCK